MRLELRNKIRQIQIDIETFNQGGQVHKLRDLVDPAEGYIREIVNSNNNYSHAFMKMNCSVKSVEAVELLKKLREDKVEPKNWYKHFHREHAIPMKITKPELMKMEDASIEEIAEFIDKRIVSVLITKEEAKQLDKKGGLKDKMPADWDGKNVFARFEAKNIKLA